MIIKPRGNNAINRRVKITQIIKAVFMVAFCVFPLCNRFRSNNTIESYVNIQHQFGWLLVKWQFIDEIDIIIIHACAAIIKLTQHYMQTHKTYFQTRITFNYVIYLYKMFRCLRETVILIFIWSICVSFE